MSEHAQIFLSLDTGGECRGDSGKVAAEDSCRSLYHHFKQSAVLSFCTATSSSDEKGDAINSSNLEAGQVLKDHTADTVVLH